MGLDRSEAMLSIAREKLPDVRFEVGDVDHLPFVDDEFDLAIVSLALCHLTDPGDAVAELARVVRPGGVLVITDPHPFGAIVGGQAFYGGMSPSRSVSWVRHNYHEASTWAAVLGGAKELWAPQPSEAGQPLEEHQTIDHLRGREVEHERDEGVRSVGVGCKRGNAQQVDPT